MDEVAVCGNTASCDRGCEQNRNDPIVSVVMPAYNVASYLAQAAESVLSQTVTDFELLIVNDFSTDETAEIAAAIAARDNRVRVLSNETNCGVAVTRNRGIAAARGTYIALLDGDDYWYPKKLEKQLSLAERSGAEIIYCSYDLVEEREEPRKRSYIVPPETDYNKMLSRNVISCSTVLLKASALAPEPFGTAKDYSEDFLLWMKLLEEGKRAIGCTEVLGAYRLMPQSRSSKKFRCARYHWKIYRKQLHLSLFRSSISFLRYACYGVKKYIGLRR